ncbi:hypothetical protein L1987_61623 [Smallanthus sonchifolius]|uniref:Uncharacterized protein n=1 Tax=Smallanthus sonchifolius TaxID=185202 RepID=A0ACB9C891_9ASTR|nr:hypothetical protein L1987_61623 [Smallanthus sonchifolius]
MVKRTIGNVKKAFFVGSFALSPQEATAAKAASSDKTAARIAMHVSGDRTPVNAKMSRYTSGATSRSFTFISCDRVTKNEFEYVKVEKPPKKKGYVQLHTTHDDLNFELHCDITPRACGGYYSGVVFHINIMSFMIQGADPSETGK